MEIINHRISRQRENNLDDILTLVNKGFKSFEVDLQLCKDEIVIYHNFTLKDKNILRNVENFNYSYLKTLGIDNIDKLFSILEKVNNINIYLDIKGYNDRLIYLLLPKLEKIKNNNIFIQSYNYNFIKLVTIFRNTHKKNWKIGYITAGYHPNFNFNTDYLVIDKSHYNLYKNCTIPLYLYTVNSKEELDKNNNIIGIFTDYPENF